MTRDTKINAALSALNQGDHASAARLCAELLQDTPDDAEIISFHGLALLPTEAATALSLLAKACQLEPQEARWHLHLGIGHGQQNEWHQAEQAYAAAAQLSGHAPQTLLPWSEALIELGRIPEAADVLSQLATSAPSKPVWQKLGSLQLDLQDFAGALTSLERSLTFGQASPEETLMIANLQVTMQRYDEAVKSFDQLLTAKPVHPDAALGAANMARAQGQAAKADEILLQGWHDNQTHAGLIAERLEGSDVEPKLLMTAQQNATRDATPLADKQTLNFALAKFFDKADDPEQAWHHATLANDQYEEPAATGIQQYVADIDAAFALFEAAKPITPSAPPPGLIYCIGPPRSGGSLLQTVLSAPPGHASLGERGALMPWLLPMLEKDQAPRLQDWTNRAQALSDADIAGMQTLFPQATLYTDKTPSHGHVAGLLYRLHPQAKFVDQRRNLKDVLVSVFLHGFKSTFTYTKSLEQIAAYLTLHRRTIDRWIEAGVPIICHDHEAFVRAPEETGKQLFDALDLAWDPAFLKRDNRTTTVRTFSVRQVREKISPAFSGRGAKYADIIGDLPAEFEQLL